MKKVWMTASASAFSGSMAMPRMSLSSPAPSVIFCRWETWRTEFNRSRKCAASSKFSASEAACIFSERSFVTVS